MLIPISSRQPASHYVWNCSLGSKPKSVAVVVDCTHLLQVVPDLERSFYDGRKMVTLFIYHCDRPRVHCNRL